jgi:hypothetical protein
LLSVSLRFVPLVSVPVVPVPFVVSELVLRPVPICPVVVPGLESEVVELYVELRPSRRRLEVLVFDWLFEVVPLFMVPLVADVSEPVPVPTPEAEDWPVVVCDPVPVCANAGTVNAAAAVAINTCLIILYLPMIG